MPPERTLALWCPAWALSTARRVDPSLAGIPVVVVERGARGLVVCAASPEARAEGVRIGLRRREAEARCAGLTVVERDSAAEARAFEAVARATEPITPAVVLERPGVLTFPTRGPARYFGGDEALAARVLALAADAGAAEARVGVADGSFAARLAARAAPPGTAHVVHSGGTRRFLAPWPVMVLADVVGERREDGVALADLLTRLGLRTLGDLAALPASSVLARFGVDGARAHRLAAGDDELTAPPAPPPPDLVATAELDPPASRVDEAAFVAKALADDLLERLAVLGLACDRVVVEAETEHGERHVRCWRHEGGLTAAALVARVRWQLEAWLVDGASECDRQDDEATGGLVLLRLAPDRVVPAQARQLGFWGGDAAAHDRAARVLARLQGMLGHDAVVTAVVGGGRAPSERVRWVPWGEPREDADAPGAPWPGLVPGPAPARVHREPVAAELLDAAGSPVRVSGRGEASAEPAVLRCAALPGGGGDVTAWAGPWLHDLRWWTRARRRRVLWQVVVGHGEDGVACLVALERGRAAVEAVYD
ncbi:MAG TPA: DNA polymerase Y family protein [Acidimicrobiia bacterium]